jgi:hypothetical protein
VLFENIDVAVAQALEQPSRALDVAEQQRHYVGRKRHALPAIVSRARHAAQAVGGRTASYHG